jgi:uncharacterized membrane protein YfcA
MGTCRHKSILPSLPTEWYGYCVFSIVLALCNVGGVGGGGVANPLIIIFFHFKTKEAIAISSLTILMSSVARFLFILNERNPKKPFVVLIDYGLASVMMPATLAGS